MESDRISFHGKPQRDQRHDAEDHLPCRDHGWSKFKGTPLEKHIRECRPGRAKRDSQATPECHYAAAIEQAAADQRYSAEGDQCAG
jgi:hypothetical protein